MTEEIVERTDEPVTTASLASDIRALGVESGDTVLVHSSLSALGWVCGGAPAVVDALQEVVTETGTIVMPTHSSHYCNPEEWSNPPVPDEWVERIHESMPAFRPEVTPTRLGAVPECFRTYPATLRSDHPELSFAAWGADAETIVSDHGLDYSLGDHSPLARVYDLGGAVLLLGVGHDANTSLHLAEYRADCPTETKTNGGPILQDGQRVWTEYEDIRKETDDFSELGAAFEQYIGLTTGSVGAATAKLVNQPQLVDFATEWFEVNR